MEKMEKRLYIDEIKKILPHREPMLLIDEAYYGEGGAVHGSYTVSGDEWFLGGHYPGNPIVPGVIQCEMAAQSCGLLFADRLSGSGSFPVFAGIDKVKFRSPVKPGDTVVFTCEKTREIGPFCFARFNGKVGGKLCVSGELSFAIVKEV